MIDKRTIFEIHRLKHLGWSNRKIARHLRIDRGSVKKYASNPAASNSIAADLQARSASGLDQRITGQRSHGQCPGGIAAPGKRWL